MQEFKANIITRIIAKGGIYGLSAKNFANHEIYSGQVIVECFEQCHHKEASELWGNDLVKDIIEYRFYLLSELRKELRSILSAV